RHGPSQGRTASPCARVVAPPVHGDHVTRSGTPRGHRAVHRHRELVTVYDLRSVTTQEFGERRDALPVERAAQHVGARGETARAELAARSEEHTSELQSLA